IDEEHLEVATRLAQELGVTIDVKSRLTDDEVMQHYQRASMFLYAPRLEPFGLAPLEASCCGAPIVAVAEGGVRETVEEMKTGLVVDGDPAQMGAAIDRLFADPSLARNLGQNGAGRVRQRWTWESAIDRLEGHLRAVAGVSETIHSSASVPL